MIFEWCPHCGKEVELQEEFKWQRCPECNEMIKPCSLCDMDQVKCKKCELDLGTQIEGLIKGVLDESIKKHGESFTDDHHAYAVIKEEIEEAGDELNYINAYLESMWGRIREDLGISHEVMVIRRRTIRLIKEALQVTAVCEKYMRGLEDKDKPGVTCKDGICSIDWGEES